ERFGSCAGAARATAVVAPTAAPLPLTPAQALAVRAPVGRRAPARPPAARAAVAAPVRAARRVEPARRVRSAQPVIAAAPRLPPASAWIACAARTGRWGAWCATGRTPAARV